MGGALLPTCFPPRHIQTGESLSPTMACSRRDYVALGGCPFPGAARSWPCGCVFHYLPVSEPGRLPQRHMQQRCPSTFPRQRICLRCFCMCRLHYILHTLPPSCLSAGASPIQLVHPVVYGYTRYIPVRLWQLWFPHC